MAPDYIDKLKSQMQAISGISSVLESLKGASAMLDVMKAPSISSAMLEAMKGPSISSAMLEAMKGPSISSAMLEAMKGPSISSAMLEAMKGPSISSAMLEAMKGPSISSAMLEAMKGPSISSAMLEAMKGPSISSAMLEAMKGPSISSAMLESMRVTSVYMEALKEIENSVAMQAIKGLTNTPFNEAILACSFANLGNKSVPSGNSQFVADEEITSELLAALRDASDFNLLSERAKAVLFHLYQSYLVPFVIGCLTTVYMTHLTAVQKEMKNAGTPTEVKVLARKGSQGINKDILKGYRVVTAPTLQFRAHPSMQSEIFMALPLGQLLEVLNDSKRAWLHVKVDIEGEILDGWVLRRYTTYFK